MSLPLFEKKYYKIGEVSKLTELEPHVLRYWEKEFAIIRPKKDSGNQRLYSKNDLNAIFDIKRLLYDENFTIAGAKKQVRQKSKKTLKTLKKVVTKDKSEILKEIKTELESIRELLS